MHKAFLSIIFVLVMLLAITVFLYQEATIELNNKEKLINDLLNENSNVKSEYNSLKIEYNNLKAEYEKTIKKLNETQKLLREEKIKREQLKTVLFVNIKKSLEYLANRINHRFNGGEDFIRPYEVKDIVNALLGHKFNEKTLSKDLYKMFLYVKSNIRYSRDTVYPVIEYYNISLEDSSYNITIKIRWVTQEHQYPRETLERREGDCEDMAYLLASMLQYYFEDIKEYEVYVIAIFKNDKGHAATLVRHKSGLIAILDPSGNYFTGSKGKVRFIKANIEVMNWLNYWNISKNNFKGALLINILGEASIESIDGLINFLDYSLV